MLVTSFVDISSSRLLRNTIDPNGLRHLGRIKRGDTLSLTAQFIDATQTVQDLGISASGMIGFKPKGNHNATGYCANAAWVKSGSGLTALYTFTLTFLNSVMNALFVIGDATAADEVTNVDLIGEIKWTDSSAVTHETPSDFVLRVMNDVNQGGETTTNVPAQAQAVVLPQITRQTGGVAATDLDAQALAAFPLLTCFDIVVALAGGSFSASRWQKRTGTHATDTAAGYILCLDGTQLIRVSGL